MKRKRPPPLRYLKPSWNAKRSKCERCGLAEENAERLLLRLNLCAGCRGGAPCRAT